MNDDQTYFYLYFFVAHFRHSKSVIVFFTLNVTKNGNLTVSLDSKKR